jgi:citrate synthase
MRHAHHSLGYPYVYPDNDLSYTENFMNMLWKMVEPKYVANPGLDARSCAPDTPAPFEGCS